MGALLGRELELNDNHYCQDGAHELYTTVPLSHDLTSMIVHFSNLIIACDILSQMDVNN